MFLATSRSISRAATLAFAVFCGGREGSAQGLSGDWAVTPTASYTCAFGTVTLSISRIRIIDSYPTVQVVLMPTFSAGTLRGSFTSATQFTASVYYPGSCSELYTLTLGFTDPAHATGTFDAAFTGMGTCLDCSTRRWSITANRLPRATWSNYGTGFSGRLGVPAFTATSNPVLGGSVTTNLQSSLGAATPGLLLLGLQQANLPTAFGGALLVVPALTAPLAVPASGLVQTWAIPPDPNLFAAAVYLQCLELDSGAAQQLSFTRGLALSIGS